MEEVMHYIEIFKDGEKSQIERVESRDPSLIKQVDGMVGFRFFDRSSVYVNNQIYFTHPYNYSKTILFGGILSSRDMKDYLSESKINFDYNDNTRIIEYTVFKTVLQVDSNNEFLTYHEAIEEYTNENKKKIK